MSAVTATSLPVRSVRRTAVVRALAAAEARRMLRNPILWIGAATSVWAMWSVVPTPDEWPGASYESMPTTSAPLMAAISVVAAVAFHRERAAVAGAAPTGEGVRAAARLLAASALVGIAIPFTALIAWRERSLGGLWLGTEPGRTTEALHTSGELAQHVALALVAVTLGAALGRRMSRTVSTIPVLFVAWFVASIYWMFSHPLATPFAIIQVQPIRVEAGPASTDPLTFPSRWLLEAPGEYSETWQRLVVSDALGWWHVTYLLGLSCLLAAFAVPAGRARRSLIAAGVVLAALGVAAQVVVLP